VKERRKKQMHGRRLKVDILRRAVPVIVTLLRQIEVSMAQGKPTPVACRDAGISQQNYAMSC
jgi:hypothetical protein